MLGYTINFKKRKFLNFLIAVFLVSVHSKQKLDLLNTIEKQYRQRCLFETNELMRNFFIDLTYLLVIYCDFDYMQSYMMKPKLEGNVEEPENLYSSRLSKVARASYFNNQSIIFIQNKTRIFEAFTEEKVTANYVPTPIIREYTYF